MLRPIQPKAIMISCPESEVRPPLQHPLLRTSNHHPSRQLSLSVSRLWNPLLRRERLQNIGRNSVHVRRTTGFEMMPATAPAAADLLWCFSEPAGASSGFNVCLSTGTSLPLAGLLRVAIRRRPMTKLKILSGVVILSAAIAAPAFAQGVEIWGPGSRYGWEPEPGSIYHYGRSCIQGPGFGEPCRGRLYGWSIGRDRSRVGGEAPSLRPSGS